MIGWYNTLSSLEQIFALVAIAASTFLILQTLLQIFGLGSQFFADSDAEGPDSFDGADDIDTDGPDGGFDTADMIDIDGDGIPDVPAFEFDSDFDGEFEIDSDIDLDTDGDGIPDAVSPAAQVDFDDDLPSSREVLQSSEPSLRLFTMRSMVAFFAIAGWSGLIALQSDWSLPAVFGLAFVAGAAGAYVVAKILQVVLRLQYSGNVSLENAIGLSGDVYVRIPAHSSGKGKITMTLQERFVEVDALNRSEEPLATGRKVRVVGLADENTVIVKPID